MGVLRVGVLGAGVVGATSVLELQSEFPTADVTLIADKFYQDTTSDGAAGIFRPGLEFVGPNEEITEKWIKDSYDYYRNLMDVEPGSGISSVGGYYFSNRSARQVRSQVLEKILPVYRVATHDELDNYSGQKWKYGAYYETLLTECSRFLPWALTKFQAQGGHLRTQTVHSLAQLQGEFDILVNCCGLSANYLCNDKMMFPIRGQVIKVQAPWLKQFWYAESDTYIIPSPSGSVTLGGCRQFNNYSLEVNRHDTAKILEGCYNFVPSLRKATILREWVGLRPFRAVVRVEPEQIGSLKVIHNYGHGGYGVTAAPGTAITAVRLVKQALTGNSKL